jgi:hypothetical protein
MNLEATTVFFTISAPKEINFKDERSKNVVGNNRKVEKIEMSSLNIRTQTSCRKGSGRGDRAVV